MHEKFAQFICFLYNIVYSRFLFERVRVLSLNQEPLVYICNYAFPFSMSSAVINPFSSTDPSVTLGLQSFSALWYIYICFHFFIDPGLGGQNVSLYGIMLSHFNSWNDFKWHPLNHTKHRLEQALCKSCSHESKLVRSI